MCIQFGETLIKYIRMMDKQYKETAEYLAKRVTRLKMQRLSRIMKSPISYVPLPQGIKETLFMGSWEENRYLPCRDVSIIMKDTRWNR